MIRKKKILDGTDKEILRNLRAREIGLSGSRLAKAVGISPSAITPRLKNLKKKGIIVDECKGFRNFKRKFGTKTKTVRSCSKRVWKLDLA